MSKGLSIAEDLTLGHYMHVPPILLFSVQVLATRWGGLVNVGVLYWALDNVGICTSHAVQNFGCPKTTAFFTNSVVWGAVGPQRMFERGQIYDAMLFFFLISAVAQSHSTFWYGAIRMAPGNSSTQPFSSFQQHRFHLPQLSSIPLSFVV